jgi:hypothetical protein
MKTAADNAGPLGLQAAGLTPCVGDLVGCVAVFDRAFDVAGALHGSQVAWFDASHGDEVFLQQRPESVKCRDDLAAQLDQVFVFFAHL